MNQRMYQLGSKRSVIREIFEFGKTRAQEIGAENVYDFSLGNPSVEPPACVKDTLLKLIKEPDQTALHGYTSAQGDLFVRRAIASHIRGNYDENADENYIYMTVGAAASLTITLSALCGEGDEVVTFAPYFTEYKVFAETAGARLVAVESDPDTFQIDFEKLEAVLGKNTRAVLVNSPNNPSWCTAAWKFPISRNSILPPLYAIRTPNRSPFPASASDIFMSTRKRRGRKNYTSPSAARAGRSVTCARPRFFKNSSPAASAKRPTCPSIGKTAIRS